MPAAFTLRIDTPLPPTAATAALFDLEAHAAVLPLTSVRHDGRPLAPGTRFVSRTGIGPLAVDDAMIVETYDVPAAGPAHIRIVKTGRIVTGRIEVDIHPRGDGSRVTWRQSLGLAGVPRLADPVIAAVARLAYRSAIRALLARPPVARGEDARRIDP